MPSDPVAPSPGLGHVPALDGLRAVCALLVVSWHVRGHTFETWQGGVGVYVFFVLSGFLITTIGTAEERRRGSVDLRGFFVRRATRILPLFLVVLAAYAVAVLGFDVGEHADRFRDALPYHLVFLSELPHVWYGAEVPFDVAWSLGIEEKFYVVWALLGFGLLRHARGRAVVAVGLLVASVVVSAASHQAGAYVQYYAYVLVGVLLALARDSARWRPLVDRAASPRIGIAAVLVAVTLSHNPYAGWELWPVLFGLASAVLVAHLVVGTGPLVRFLSRPRLVRLGALSYGIYLLHQLTLGIGEEVLPDSPAGNLACFAVGLAGAIALASLLHRTVEQPMIRWGRDRSGRPVR